jgi:hypothetical protein
MSNVVNADDPRVLQLRELSPFVNECCGCRAIMDSMGVQELDGHGAAQLRVVCTPHLPKSATTQQLGQPVSADLAQWGSLSDWRHRSRGRDNCCGPHRLPARILARHQRLPHALPVRSKAAAVVLHAGCFTAAAAIIELDLREFHD